VEASCGHRDRGRRPLHPRRGIPPGLPAEEPGGYTCHYLRD
jgi:hypothetical protein